MAQYFDRYEKFTGNGGVKTLPFIKISESPSDKQVAYRVGKTRFDNLSQEYYSNPYHGFLIMLANPKYGGLEFNIKDGDVIRVPFPFNRALIEYQTQVANHEKLYGL